MQSDCILLFSLSATRIAKSFCKRIIVDLQLRNLHNNKILTGQLKEYYCYKCLYFN